MVLLSSTTPALASSFNFVTAVIGMLLGVSLGQETVTGREWIAVAIIVIGVTGVVLGRGTRAESAQ
jgi:drug/metabolite transporter (DMT)-like permease